MLIALGLSVCRPTSGALIAEVFSQAYRGVANGKVNHHHHHHYHHDDRHHRRHHHGHDHHLHQHHQDPKLHHHLDIVPKDIIPRGVQLGCLLWLWACICFWNLHYKGKQDLCSDIEDISDNH